MTVPVPVGAVKVVVQVAIVGAPVAASVQGVRPAGVRVTVPVGDEPVPWLVSVTVTVQPIVWPMTT